MKGIKPLLPSLREKKRYVVFEVRSPKPIRSFATVANTVQQNMLNLCGELGLAGAGLILLKDKWNPKTQRGVAKVSHRWVSPFKASLTFVKELEGKPVIVRSVGTSGMIRKAEQYVAA